MDCFFFQRDHHLMFWHVCSSLKCWHKGTWSKCYRLDNGIQRYLGLSFSVLIPKYFVISNARGWTRKWQHPLVGNMDSFNSLCKKHLFFLKTIRKYKERSCSLHRWQKGCSVNCYINRGIPFYCQKGILLWPFWQCIHQMILTTEGLDGTTDIQISTQLTVTLHTLHTSIHDIMATGDPCMEWKSQIHLVLLQCSQVRGNQSFLCVLVTRH